MTRLSSTRLAVHLGRLDHERLTAFIADLWAARGFETAVDGTVVVAERDRDRTTIYPVSRSRLRGVSPPGQSVDVVVAPGAGLRARRYAARAEARLLTTADVRELLLFAIDPDDLTTICERYFGASPTDLRLPVGRRILTAVRSRGGKDLGASVVTGLVVLVVVAGVAGIAITAEGPSRAGDPVGVSTPSDPTDVEPLVANATPVVIEDEVHFPIEPPGLDRSGITDRTALSAAHDRGLRNRSYTIWIDLHRPRNGDANTTRIKRDIDVTVEGDQYRVTTTIEGSSTRDQQRVLDLYNDGTARYAAQHRGEVVDYGRLARNESTTVLPEPPELRRSMVDTYLSTPETDLTGIETRERRTYYRVIGNGTPWGLPGVHDYQVTAMVDTDGIVRELTAEYVVSTPGGRYPVRLEITYDDLFWTTVEAPSWYETRFGVNGTQGGH